MIVRMMSLKIGGQDRAVYFSDVSISSTSILNDCYVSMEL